MQTYSRVTLANQSEFVTRAVGLINTTDWAVNWFTNHGTCGGTSACSPAGDALSQSFLLGVSLLDTISGNTLEGDLILYLFGLPPSTAELAVINAALTTPVVLPPTVAVAYYEWSETFSSNFKVATFDTTGSAFCVYQTYEAIIEYVDTNGTVTRSPCAPWPGSRVLHAPCRVSDGPASLIVRPAACRERGRPWATLGNGHYDLGEGVGLYNLATAAWGPKTGKLTFVGGTLADYVYTISGATLDGVATLSCAASNVPVIDNNGQIVTPNNTKCSFEINNYPYTVRAALARSLDARRKGVFPCRAARI